MIRPFDPSCLGHYVAIDRSGFVSMKSATELKKLHSSMEKEKDGHFNANCFHRGQVTVKVNIFDFCVKETM